MPYIETITAQKARRINSTASIYGTFAEIGAGQEVVNHFFKAGLAGQTVAKSMSAYDMDFSDDIYGRSDRYVSEKRLFKMLDHEYHLLQKRLKKKRGFHTKFFAFADTVTTKTIERTSDPYSHKQHGWLGIRFQNKPQAPVSEMIVHVNLMDTTRLQQHESLGILGVNLIYCAFYVDKTPKKIIASLFDNFEANRVDIDVLRCSGGLFKSLNRQELNLELIRQKLTQSLLFQNTGKNILPSDALYNRPVLIIRHSPTTNMDSVIHKALATIKKKKLKNPPPVLLIDIDIMHLKQHTLNYFLKTYTLKVKNIPHWYILISHFEKLYELKAFIRTATSDSLFIFLPPKTLNKFLNKKTYKTPDKEDVLTFFSKLCGPKTTLLTYDWKKEDKYSPVSSHTCYRDLKHHLISANQLVTID